LRKSEGCVDEQQAYNNADPANGFSTRQIALLFLPVAAALIEISFRGSSPEIGIANRCGWRTHFIAKK
jgi:hypothetical protein